MNYSRNNDIADSELDGEICIFDPNNGEYFNLNNTATFIWKLIDKNTPEDYIVSKTINEFLGKELSIKEEILGFLKDAVNKGILISSND